MSTTGRHAAEHEPIARVLPMLSVPHLDREFDYLVSAEQSDDAQPGVRVRVRFHGRLVDAFVLERRSDTDHVGQLGWLDRVISAEPVLTGEVRRLVDAVAARYAGTRPDVLRLAIPPRHAAAEKTQREVPPLPVIEPVDPAGWGRYTGGGKFLDALREGRAARAMWQVLPGERWCDRLAEAAAAAVSGGHGVLIIVPDQRDIDALLPAATALIDESAVVALAAGLGPSARYRRWLSVLRGQARLVIGTRSAVFAPVDKLGVVMVWDDGDDSLSEPRAPYPHAREVAMLRAHQLRCAALIGGYSRTAEAQALIASGWAHDLVAARPSVRAEAPRVVALDDTGFAEERDPAARTARLPSVALRTARAALERGTPVLVQVPRRGYVPSVACGRCRTIARCRHCMGPLSLSDRGADGAVCRWCGRIDIGVKCRRCGADEVRAVVVGARRTAEELGRAFAGIPVITSAGDSVHTEIAAGPALVVATPGAEPRAPDDRDDPSSAPTSTAIRSLPHTPRVRRPPWHGTPQPRPHEHPHHRQRPTWQWPDARRPDDRRGRLHTATPAGGGRRRRVGDSDCPSLDQMGSGGPRRGGIGCPSGGRSAAGRPQRRRRRCLGCRHRADRAGGVTG